MTLTSQILDILETFLRPFAAPSRKAASKQSVRKQEKRMAKRRGGALRLLGAGFVAGIGAALGAYFVIRLRQREITRYVYISGAEIPNKDEQNTRAAS